MKFRVGLIALAMTADLVTFALVVPVVGIGAESNPIMRRAYFAFGLGLVAALKVACTIVIVLLVARVPRRRLPTMLAVGFGLLGTVANVAAIP